MSAPRDAQLAVHEFLSADPAETERVAEALGRLLTGGEILALHGELGAGKTCFVRGLAAGLGVPSEEIASPTFVIAVEHRGARLGLVHVDAYRLHTLEELESIGLDELLGGAARVVAIEWPERLGAALPNTSITVELEHAGPTTRALRISGPTALVHSWSRAIGAAEGGQSGSDASPGLMA